MKIVVDEMPKKSSDCIFLTHKLYPRHETYCCLSQDYDNGACPGPMKCPFLIESWRIMSQYANY